MTKGFLEIWSQGPRYGGTQGVPEGGKNFEKKFSSDFFFHELSGKNRRLSLILDSCWRNEVSNFRLRKFRKVEPFCEPLGWHVDINTRNSLDHSGSNEAMQKVLALIV